MSGWEKWNFMWERKIFLLKFNPFKLYSLVTKFILSLFLSFLLQIMILSLKLPVYMHWTFGDDLVSSLLVTFGNKLILSLILFKATSIATEYFVPKNLNFSDAIFHHYRLIKFTPSFFPLVPLFWINNSDENYFSLLNAIIFSLLATKSLIRC